MGHITGNVPRRSVAFKFLLQQSYLTVVAPPPTLPPPSPVGHSPATTPTSHHPSSTPTPKWAYRTLGSNVWWSHCCSSAADAPIPSPADHSAASTPTSRWASLCSRVCPSSATGLTSTWGSILPPTHQPHLTRRLHPGVGTLLVRTAVLVYEQTKVWIFNNYSPKWRWIAVDIYRAASAR